MLSAVLIRLVRMGNSTARDKSRIQAEGESESGATIEALPSADIGNTRDVSFIVILWHNKHAWLPVHAGT